VPSYGNSYKDGRVEALLVTDDSNRPIMRVQNSTFTNSVWSCSAWNKEKALAHITPVHSKNGKLLALLVNSEQPLQMAIGAGRFLCQTIYSVKPRCGGAAVERTHEGVDLYRWALVTVLTHGGGTSYSFPIDLASQGGCNERLGEYMLRGWEAGTFVAADGSPIGVVERDSNLLVKFSFAAGTDVGLLMLCFIAACKNQHDCDHNHG
jgi:hypothetical protein